MPQPLVTQLAVTAVKGFGMQQPAVIALEHGGAVGNRDFFMVDDERELFSVTRSGAFLPYWSAWDQLLEVLTIGRGDEICHTEEIELGREIRTHFDEDRYVTGLEVLGGWTELLSDLAGRHVTLAKAAEPAGGYDVEPVTLVGEASVAALGRELDGATLDERRFRLLLTVAGTTAFEEDTWAGREVAIGSSVLRMRGPVPRCAAVQLHPDDGARGVNTLRRINEVRGVQPYDGGRGLNLGVYAEVVRPGVVRRGDAVVLG
jgi:hypothetical protein